MGVPLKQLADVVVVVSGRADDRLDCRTGEVPPGMAVRELLSRPAERRRVGSGHKEGDEGPPCAWGVIHQWAEWSEAGRFSGGGFYV